MIGKKDTSYCVIKDTEGKQKFEADRIYSGALILIKNIANKMVYMDVKTKRVYVFTSIGINLLFALNYVFVKKLVWIHEISLFASLVLSGVIAVVVLSRKELDPASIKRVKREKIEVLPSKAPSQNIEEKALASIEEVIVEEEPPFTEAAQMNSQDVVNSFIGHPMELIKESVSPAHYYSNDNQRNLNRIKYNKMKDNLDALGGLL